LEVLKRKPNIDLFMVNSFYKSTGYVLNRKTRAVFLHRVVRGRFSTCSVTNARMQEITGESSKDITAVLQTLVRDGLLTQQNQRRWASYRVAEDSPHLAPGSPKLQADSTQLARKVGFSAELQAREGALELRYADVRNRPDQAYRTVPQAIEKGKPLSHASRKPTPS
jgi:hypothetical protein